MFDCVICKRSFTGSKEFETHFEYFHKEDKGEQVQTNSTNFKCNICGTNIVSRSGFYKHMRNFHGKRRFKCEYCRNEFTQNAHLQKHQRRFHPVESGLQPDSITCEFCDVTIKFKLDYKKHVDIVHRGIKEFECNLCEKAFTASHSLKKHVNISHARNSTSSTEEVLCDICNMKFTRKGSLTIHVTNKHIIKLHQCKQCEKAFNRKNSLETHIKNVHKKVRRFECKICDKEFYYKKDCLRHEALHENGKTNQSSNQRKRNHCEVCDKHFISRKGLSDHVEAAHLKEKELSKCSRCSEKFWYKKDLNQHVKDVHAKRKSKISSNNNDKAIKRKNVIDNSFESHIEDVELENVSVEEKNRECAQEAKIDQLNQNDQFLSSKDDSVIFEMKNIPENGRNNLKCDICEKLFNSKDTLRNHRQSYHNGIKSFCTFCDKIFPSNLHLAAHIDSSHKIQKDQNENDYECDFCGKMFKKHCTMVLHKSTIHLNEKRSECKKCNKAFKQPCNLRRHIRLIHEEQQINFECQFCKKGFALKANLQRHVKESHQTTKVKCNFCDMVFIDNKRNLKRHILKAHKQEIDL